jgi:hypothetical protein
MDHIVVGVVSVSKCYLFTEVVQQGWIDLHFRIESVLVKQIIEEVRQHEMFVPFVEVETIELQLLQFLLEAEQHFPRDVQLDGGSLRGRGMTLVADFLTLLRRLAGFLLLHRLDPLRRVFLVLIVLHHRFVELVRSDLLDGPLQLLLDTRIIELLKHALDDLDHLLNRGPHVVTST